MKITKIEIQKRNKEKANIYVDDKYSFSLSLNGLIESKIKEGADIDEEIIERLKLQDAPRLASVCALNIISYSMKTEKELRRKLSEKKFDDKAIDYAINKMKSYGYLDDAHYVKTYIETRAVPQNWGEQKIIINLLQKGVDINLIKNVIEEVYSDDMKKEAISEVVRKYSNKLNSGDRSKDKQKLYRYLASKGYSYDLINTAITEYFDNNQYD